MAQLIIKNDVVYYESKRARTSENRKGPRCEQDIPGALPS